MEQEVERIGGFQRGQSRVHVPESGQGGDCRILSAGWYPSFPPFVHIPLPQPAPEAGGL